MTSAVRSGRAPLPQGPPGGGGRDQHATSRSTGRSCSATMSKPPAMRSSAGRHLHPDPGRDTRGRLLRRAAPNPRSGRSRSRMWAWRSASSRSRRWCRPWLRPCGERSEAPKHLWNLLGPNSTLFPACVAVAGRSSSPRCPTPSRAHATSRSGPSTACSDRGHQAVINGSDTVLTFEPHPLEILHPAALPKLHHAVRGQGRRSSPRSASRSSSSSRSTASSRRPPQEFIDDVLIGLLRAKRVSVGENFRFGGQGQGTRRCSPPDGASRRASCRLWRSTGDRLDPDPRRSSRPARWQGRRSASAAPFMVAAGGEGDQRRRELGFPTANIVPTTASPSRATASTRPRATAFRRRSTSASAQPSNTGRGVLIETYLIDHEEDLYGTMLRVAFVKRLRGQKRFAGVEEAHRPDANRCRGREPGLCASFTPR